MQSSKHSQASPWRQFTTLIRRNYHYFTRDYARTVSAFLSVLRSICF
jgi:hypothetical protein